SLFCSDPSEAEGCCVPAGDPTLNSQRWVNALDDINDHQLIVEKRMKSHDDRLMLIISMVGRYSMRRYCDR
ncbi:hypothetical protein L195_g059626, partial [Trifolium pratense]